MKASKFCSQYVIGGSPQEFTPAQMLDAVCETPHFCPSSDDTVIDEVIDPVLLPLDVDPAKTEDYLKLVCGSSKKMQLAFSGTYTRVRLLSSLVDSLWHKGHYKLGDISLAARWKWNMAPVGAASAFYESVQSAADLMDALGLKLSSYSLEDNGESSLEFSASLSKDSEDMDDIFVKEAFRSDHPFIDKDVRKCPDSLVPDPQSWLIYVPFATCDYRLGGSLLSQSLELGGGVAPQVADPDYFIDCHEVLRELVEDGIVISGVTVGEGGLACAAKRMTKDGVGVSLDLSGLASSYSETNPVRLLFSEIPGALIQIRDIDFDYIDAELLLQDVAYFPLGHPSELGGDLHIDISGKSGIQTILESLIQNAEGED